VDYDIEILDTNPAAVAEFTQTRIGMLSTGDQPNPPWFYVDNVVIYDGLVLDPYAPVTYYVDQNHPQASDDNPGTESLPWLTIKRRRIPFGPEIQCSSNPAHTTNASLLETERGECLAR